LFKEILAIARHKVLDYDVDFLHDKADREVAAIASWLSHKIRRLEQGERPITFRKLRQILAHFDCDFENSSSRSKVCITRKINESGFLGFKTKRTLQTYIYYGGDGREVTRKDLNRLRADLHLDDEHGIDSATFYANEPASTGEFIQKFSKILKRLSGL